MHDPQRDSWAEKIHPILDSAFDAVVMIDQSGVVVAWNTQAENLFGWSRQEAIGQPMAELIVPDDLTKEYTSGLHRYLKTGEQKILNRRVELTAKRKDGSTLPIELSVREPDEASSLFTGFIRDLTDQNAARDALQSSRDDFRLLLESTAEAIYGIDTRGLCTFCNPACVRMLGYESADDLLGQNMHQLAHHTHTDGRPYPESECHIFKAFREGNGTHVNDEVLWRKDGTSFNAEYWSYPMRRDGDIVGCVVTILDITERLAADESLARMGAIVDSSYDAIIGKDLNGTIVTWNRGAERVYGFKEHEALGQSISLILPANLRVEEAEVVDATESGQRLEQFETVRRHKNGGLIPVSLTISPIRGSNGRIIGSSSIERDITVSKRQEEELRTAKEAAESSEQRALKAMRVRGEFLANVSHELRTPMNAIIGMTQLALGEDLSDEIRDYIETANESAHSLLILLNDILDFSKIESGKFTIEREAFSLRETIDETLKALSNKAFEKGLELVCDIDSQAPDRIFGDPGRIRQILTNLISNAIKFTDQGEILVQIRVIRNWPREVRLRFAVTDTGIGISAEDQQKILEPFTQGDASATRRHGGTGLGLAICNELLRLMGGKMTIKSEEGVGSAFSFRLSFDRDESEELTPVGVTPIEELHEMRVLIIDDNATNRQIVRQAFINWSMQPDTAADGEQALALLKEAKEKGQPYPLVIVDALMPSMDGYEVSQSIHTMFGDGSPVILMASSTDRQNFRDKEADAGIAAYLSKPVSQSDLMDAVMRALNVEAAAAPPTHEKIEHSSATGTLAVLLAEDTTANQKVVTSILNKRGHAVTVANNGREAADLFESGKFDVVLMDVQMPIMDGFQATAAIRQIESGKEENTPIIAMTAHAMRGDRERCLQAGMDAYIAKPIDVNELLELVESVAAKTDAAVPSTDSSSDHTRAVDLEASLKRLGGDTDLLREFIGYFDEDTPKLLKELRAALDDGNAYDIQRHAHSIKGLAANFDGKRAVDTASEIEQLGAANNLEPVSSFLPELEARVAEVAQALDEYRKR